MTQTQIDALIAEHSEWTPQGSAIVDSHRRQFARALLSSALATEGGERKYTQADMERYGKCYADARDKRLAAPQSQVDSKSAESDKQEVVYQRKAGFSEQWLDVSKDAYDSTPDDCRRIVYAAPLAQSAEQDRIDAELRFLDDDEITEAANKFRLGNPRFDTLRCFVNYVIIVAQHKGASK